MTPIPPPPKLSKNEIDAMYWQEFNNGSFYVGQLGSHPIGIDEWRRKLYKDNGVEEQS